MRRLAAALTVLLLCGCPDRGSGPHTSAALPSGSATAPHFTREQPTGGVPPSETAAAGSAAPDAAASSSADPVSSAVPAASATATPAAALPDVEVENIGMHIGGGPHDAATKRPIRAAVEPHHDALRACYAKAIKPGKEETFGVDIRIGRDGGKAKISHPRTGLDGEDVKACMVAVFESIDFARPPKGAPMTVSFSLRFRRAH